MLFFWSVYSSDDMDGPVEDIGSRSCVTRFVKTLLSIMEHGVKPHSKHLTEYFAFLYEFAKMGEEEVDIPYSLYLFICLFYFLYYILILLVYNFNYLLIFILMNVFIFTYLI